MSVVFRVLPAEDRMGTGRILISLNVLTKINARDEWQNRTVHCLLCPTGFVLWITPHDLSGRWVSVTSQLGSRRYLIYSSPSIQQPRKNTRNLISDPSVCPHGCSFSCSSAFIGNAQLCLPVGVQHHKSCWISCHAKYQRLHLLITV